MPWSFCVQSRRGGVGAGDQEAPCVVVDRRRAGRRAGAAAPSSSPYTSIWRWFHAPLPTRTGRLSFQPAQVRQLALGQVVLAADAEHDLQTRAGSDRRRRGRGHEGEEVAGLVGQAATQSASMVKLASRTQE